VDLSGAWSTQPGHPFAGRRNEYQQKLVSTALAPYLLSPKRTALPENSDGSAQLIIPLQMAERLQLDSVANHVTAISSQSRLISINVSNALKICQYVGKFYT